ncbi:hypothetical protein ACFUIT_19080 [Streptomyces sp. NPDC057239]|uniref:hypothetical protein n=1 Tax=Streptomyces sp. NPDC057239 TaxID=3346061 RepID=UPI0036419563
MIQAIGLHEKAVQGPAGIPEPVAAANAKILAAGHADLCAAKEGSTVLLLAAAVNENRVAVFDGKCLLDGKWVPDSASGG